MNPNEFDAIAARVRRIQERIAEAAERRRRDYKSICLLAATKGQPAEALRAAYEAGIRNFGENYVQEGVAKRRALSDLTDATWHLIGHLQRNKAALAVENFAIIHTLDSKSLVERLVHVSRTRKPMALIEVNLAGEPSKHGVAPEDLEPLAEFSARRIDLRGLMAIPPASERPEDSRRYFAQLRELRDRVATRLGLEMPELSMGMSNDFEIAIEEGATIVRVGRALFGARPSR